MLPCVILAGGLGTRMRPATETVPKALIPVLGRPFADWQLRHLTRQGVERVIYSVGYRGDMLKSHVGDGARFGLQVTWVDEGERLRGTGGALRLALDRGVLDEAFFVLYGDSYLPASMAAVEHAWRECAGPALMAVIRNEGRWDASNAIYADGKVIVYDKRRPDRWRDRMHWIDYGLSILTRQVISSGIEAESTADVADLYRDLSLAGKLTGFEVSERDRFYEAGSPSGLTDLEAYLSTEPAS